MKTKRILFACSHNAGRSQMAVAFFNAEADPVKAQAVSAGVEPADRVHPVVVDAMREVGIDLSDNKPSLLTARLSAEIDFLVTMGCGKVCPLVPTFRRADWGLEDPTDLPIERVRAIRDSIHERVRALLQDKGWGRGQ